MVGIGRAAEVTQVASNAGRAIQTVVSVDVTLRALQWNMGSGQRESGGGVIERCARPGDSCVAGVTSRRETCLGVVGVGGALVVLHVAGRAQATGQAVVPVHVTLRTLHRGMESGQRESGGRMVERAIAPRSRVVTLLACGRETGLHVGRVGRALEVRQVATYASRVREVEIVVDVTLRALQWDVRSGQGETSRAVIE